MELTSIDYAYLIQYAAQKRHHTLLNKTQINKILFYVYGAYLADTGDKLFNDDTPKAWVFGPVFPRVYRRVDFNKTIKSFSDDMVDAFNSNKKALRLVASVVDRVYNRTAISLVQWSHQDDSPWYKTVYIQDVDGNLIEQKPWNTRIDDDLIKSYFSVKSNRVFDEGN